MIFMKQRIGVLLGGQSAEHEVSLRSAECVMAHLDPEKYEVIPIKIDKEGSWHFESESTPFSPCVLRDKLDVLFPVLHGPYGEDGTVQGLAELAGLPYVGPGILSSAMCMDKAVMKDLLKVGGLPTPNHLTFHKTDRIEKAKVIEALGLPLFVKPANLGSSVGINKIHSADVFDSFVKEAFHFDERILIEECIVGREIECSVLGNFDPIASLPGEVIPTHEFYSYEAKYLDEEGARFELPAKLEPPVVKEIQELAIGAFKQLRCEGMARIDFFLRETGEILINELNTIPGFTTISLYPKLWEISGIPYPELLDRLIDLAVERRNRKETLGNNFALGYSGRHGY